MGFSIMMMGYIMANSLRMRSLYNLSRPNARPDSQTRQHVAPIVHAFDLNVAVALLAILPATDFGKPARVAMNADHVGRRDVPGRVPQRHAARSFRVTQLYAHEIKTLLN